MTSTRVRRFHRDGLTFPVQDHGPVQGPAVVLLHGFPQDHSSWSAVVPELHRRGLRTLAPDQRGYARGNSPRDRRAYRLPTLAGDVLALLDEARLPSAHLVGHDWGGAVAWHLAGTSARVHSVTIVSTPHPRALAWSMTHSRQAWASSYMAFFQVPGLPERVLVRRLSRLFDRSGLPPEAAATYLRKFSAPQDLTGPLNWYRAAPVDRSHTPSSAVPTTYLWGNLDFALQRAAAGRTARHVDADYRYIELAGGHWLPETHPRAVAREIVHQVASSPT
ncbi:MAG TPA: alpha/beta fold hydrolase [Ornithinimicrobium sp.]|uniref:alpha/beta fold hydrolase n=1 Tax=Ornithinimicrobium sp. TaxID=1977084 RepID=UPI002B4A6E2B|nr:alpha/beta fold hydrolase [Ornithinimicrobium sp.]HKJ11524.1 alpha/beta fold hydrolase [Ornithinimicrobium sp.]